MPILSLELSSQILCSVAQCKLEGETYKLWLFIKTCSKTCFKQKLLWSISEIQLNSLHIFLSINQKRHRGQLFTYVKAEKRIVSGLEEFTVQRKNDCHWILASFLCVHHRNIYEVLWRHRLKISFFESIISLFQTWFYSNFCKKQGICYSS